jgi:hypothetical protein
LAEKWGVGEEVNKKKMEKRREKRGKDRRVKRAGSRKSSII